MIFSGNLPIAIPSCNLHCPITFSILSQFFSEGLLSNTGEARDGKKAVGMKSLILGLQFA